MAAKKDAGASQVEKTVEKEEEQGFRGTKVDPLPDSAHSLESGPEAPTAAEQAEALRKADS